MDRAIVISTLLLAALTWLLYKLTVLLAGGDKPTEGAPKSNTESNGCVGGTSPSRQKLIHQRLRK
jgi:hypothetical protein